MARKISKCWKKIHSGFSNTWTNKCYKGEEVNRPMVDVRPGYGGHCVSIYKRRGRAIEQCLTTKKQALSDAKDWMREHPKG